MIEADQAKKEAERANELIPYKVLDQLTPTSKDLIYLDFFHSDGTSDCVQSEVNQRAT